MNTKREDSKAILAAAMLMSTVFTGTSGAVMRNPIHPLEVPSAQPVALRAEAQIKGRWRMIAVHHQPRSSSPFQIGSALQMLNEKEFRLNGVSGTVQRLPDGHLQFAFLRAQHAYLFQSAVQGDYLRLQDADQVTYFFQKVT